MKLARAILGTALLAAAGGLRLAAQDISVGGIGWFRTDGMPDRPPQPKRPLRVDVPDELRKAADVSYAIVFRHLTADGQSLSLGVRATQPVLKRAVETAYRDWRMAAAERAGKPVPSQFWLPVIFNPAAASPGIPDATPRLLAVFPVIVEKEPPGGAAPVWATVKLDAAGVPIGVDLESPADAALRPDVEVALKHWRFAPARKAGSPVEASLRVAFLCYPPIPPVPENRTPPRVLSQEKPVYPVGQVAAGMRGEVKLNFVVDRTGKVVDPVVAESSNPAFDQPAIEALLKWKFEPARVDGRAVNCRMSVPVIFELADEPGRDAYTVAPPSRSARGHLPEELQYDTPPKPRGAVIPVFPYAALHEGREGRATVAFVVSAEGRVLETKVMAASQPEFGLALVAAVEMFRFDPALKAGRPVMAAIKIEQNFYRDGRDRDQTLDRVDRALLKREQKRPETIISANRLDAPLTPLSRRPPVFPLALRAEGRPGRATIEALIDEDGHVRLPRIVDASDPAFGYAAAQAAAAWLFAPPKSGGKPVVVRVRLPFDFAIEGEAAPGAR